MTPRTTSPKPKAKKPPAKPRAKKSSVKAKAKKSPTKPKVRPLAPSQVAAAVQKIAAPSGTARFAAGKALTVTAEKDPARVYPHFDVFVGLLRSDSKIVRWNALQILARLAPADQDRKLPGVLDDYLAFIRGNNLISAANAIGGAGRIACACPDLLDRVLPAILKVEHANYETPECRNVAIGHTLDVLEELWPSVSRRPAVAEFVRRQRSNSRAPVARRAERLTATLP